MGFFRVVGKVVKVVKRPVFRILWVLLKPEIEERIQEENRMEPSTDLSLSAQDPFMWATGLTKTLYFDHQLRVGRWMMGFIEQSGNPDGPFVDISSGPWFSGESPFQFDINQYHYDLPVTVGNAPAGTHYFRVRLYDGSTGIVSPPFAVKVRSLEAGTPGGRSASSGEI